MNNEVFYFVIHLFLVRYWTLRQDKQLHKGLFGFPADIEYAGNIESPADIAFAP